MKSLMTCKIIFKVKKVFILSILNFAINVHVINHLLSPIIIFTIYDKCQKINFLLMWRCVKKSIKLFWGAELEENVNEEFASEFL